MTKAAPRGEALEEVQQVDRHMCELCIVGGGLCVVEFSRLFDCSALAVPSSLMLSRPGQGGGQLALSLLVVLVGASPSGGTVIILYIFDQIKVCGFQRGAHAA